MTTSKSNTTPIFSLANGTVTVDDKKLIANISCTLENGAVTGVIGQNGSGKSTLMNVFARQKPLFEGSLLLDGEPVHNIGTRDFARRVAYLPQTLPPTPSLTVRELISLGRYPWHGPFGRFTKHDQEAVEHAIELTETQSLTERFVDSLSGGERQRCWIAMMLAQEAKVFLLDEPISALDVRHQLSVMKLVHEIAETQGLAVMIIVHDVNLAAQYCHRILALKEGALVWQGTPEELMQSPVLTTIYNIDMEVFTPKGSNTHFAVARQTINSSRERNS